MPTEDAYSSGHLVLFHFGTCKCSNVETNISWTCLVSGLLSFEHPSVLLFLLYNIPLSYPYQTLIPTYRYHIYIHIRPGRSRLPQTQFPVQGEHRQSVDSGPAFEWCRRQNQREMEDEGHHSRRRPGLQGNCGRTGVRTRRNHEDDRNHNQRWHGKYSAKYPLSHKLSRTHRCNDIKILIKLENLRKKLDFWILYLFPSLYGTPGHVENMTALVLLSCLLSLSFI